MKQVLVVVEGQTEEQFIKEVLAPDLAQHDVFITPKIIVTKVVRGGPNAKGGITDYGKVRRDILNSLKDRSVRVTTFIDYYQLPGDFPGYKAGPFPSSLQRVLHLEMALAKNIGNPRFTPYIQLHEFEGLLFSKIDGFAYFYPDDGALIGQIERVMQDFPNPEDINDNPATAPSKRLARILPRFDKVIQGNTIALENGLESILASCPHFRSWVECLKALG